MVIAFIALIFFAGFVFACVLSSDGAKREEQLASIVGLAGGEVASEARRPRVDRFSRRVADPARWAEFERRLFYIKIDYPRDVKPSEYFRRQCFCAAFPQDTMIPEAMSVAPDSIVVISDWPHPLAGEYSILEDIQGPGSDGDGYMAMAHYQFGKAGLTVRHSKADLDKDHIKVDGKLLRPPQEFLYIAMNKPVGCVTTTAATLFERSQSTVATRAARLPRLFARSEL